MYVGLMYAVSPLSHQKKKTAFSTTAAVLLLQLFSYDLFIHDGVNSKNYKFTKATNWGKLNNRQHHSTAQQLSNEWSHFKVLSIESKVRKLCITQGFTLGVKGLTNSSTVKYCSTAFQ